MSFTPYTFQQAQQLLAEQFAANAPGPANTNTGSSLGAVFNAEAMLFLLGQNNVAYAIAVSRLATSFGADVDSFCNPFGVIREGATAASGSVVFSTSSPASSQILIPPGTIVQTATSSTTSTGTQFTVVGDATQEGWNPSIIPGGAYVIPIGQSSVTATVNCTATGTIGNVQANTITVLYGGGGPVPAVSAVTNPDAFTNGLAQETDAAFKTRFTLLVSSGRVATANAIGAAILGVQAGLTYSLGDRLNPDGSTHYGYFTVCFNELGQNAGPSEALITAVQSAVQSVDSAGISFGVQGPTLVPVSASATFTVNPAIYVPGSAATAYETFVNNIGLDPAGATTYCPYGQVYAILYGVPGVILVDNLLLNGGTADIAAAFCNQLVAGGVSFTGA